MRETGAAHQTVQRESLEDVANGRGVGAGAWDRIMLGERGDHAAAFEKVIPRDQPAIRGERLVTAAQVELTARWQEFEIQFPFTQWVNQ